MCIHTDVCKHIDRFLLSPKFDKTLLPSRQGRITHLLSCISEAFDNWFQHSIMLK